VTPEIVRRAAAEVYDRPAAALPPWQRWLQIAALPAIAILALALAAWWFLGRSAAPEKAAEPAVASPESVAPVASGAVEQAPVFEQLGAVLDQVPGGATADTAYATLFALWGAQYQPGPEYACQQAEAAGLRCLLQRGTLAEVKTLDLPVILTLRSRRGIEQPVVLTGLHDDVGVLDVAGQSHRIAASEIADFWQGEYLLLWRPQTAEVKAFVPGMRDPDIRWLRASLATIQGEPIDPMQSDLYDEQLEGRVRQYQRERNLAADGLVSQQTQIAIIAELGLGDTPRLAQVN
jgi:general secretion pathway protein A